MSSAAEEFVRRTAIAVDELLAAARSKGHAHLVVRFGPVSPWLIDAAAARGIDLAGMVHAADTSAIRHVINQHGEATREKSRGQLPVRDEDIRDIGEVLLTPDQVVFGLTNRRGQDLIAYARRMTDGTTLYIEEVRGASKRLALASMRRLPGTIDATRLAATLDPHAQSASRRDLDIVAVPKGRKAASIGEAGDG